MNTLQHCILRVDSDIFVDGGRVGTVRATRKELTDKFGPPLAVEADGKVTYGWRLETPRGPAAIRDYWWNGENEHSLAAPNAGAARWARRWIRHHGLTAHWGTP